ncbi:hypothetical protein H5410_056446 [Solanum commersonii]|uniref:Uncharacterized protein n=1 Tax=Solanum commersonii TaxID=4109 RepID=A0A9J5WMQ4_SOLCO|nr:hypothetical protein H5410_056446 [Solanum commersonii]
MELVGPDGKIDLFSRSNDPQSKQTPDFADFCTRKPAHFQGQMIPEAVKPLVLAIFVFPMSFFMKFSWTSIKTLAVGSIGPDR